jgi:hypothetical protein
MNRSAAGSFVGFPLQQFHSEADALDAPDPDVRYESDIVDDEGADHIQLVPEMPGLATFFWDVFCIAQRDERLMAAGHLFTSFTDFSGAFACWLVIIFMSLINFGSGGAGVGVLLLCASLTYGPDVFARIICNDL